MCLRSINPLKAFAYSPIGKVNVPVQKHLCTFEPTHLDNKNCILQVIQSYISILDLTN